MAPPDDASATGTTGRSTVPSRPAGEGLEVVDDLHVLPEADPFHWSQPGQAPVFEFDDRLYRRERWVSVFLTYVRAHVGASGGVRSALLSAQRPSVVVTGRHEGGALRLAHARYSDVLLFHPGLHNEVEQLVQDAVHEAARECSRQGYAQGDKLVTEGRRLLLEDPSYLLDREVAENLAELGLSGLPPLGVSGIVELRAGPRSYLLAAWRGETLALNPDCLGPPIDGGHVAGASGADSWQALYEERRTELPWLTDAAWEPLGVLLPPPARTAIGGRTTRRCGVNVVYRTQLDVGDDPGEVLRRAHHPVEVKELVLIPISTGASPNGMPVVEHYDPDRGDVVPVVETPALSEVLAAVLTRARSARVTTTSSTGPRRARAVPTQDLTLEDAWADDLLDRHSRLSRVLSTDALGELAEQAQGTNFPMAQTLAPVFDAVREYELARRAGQLKAADDARLFEAVVYRVARHLFANDERRALRAHDTLLPSSYRDRSERDLLGTPPRGWANVELNPIGTAYSAQLQRAYLADEIEDPAGVWRNVVREQLEILNQDEAAQEYSEVSRRGRLLCFCAALWSLEAKRSPDAAAVALDGSYRRSLSGDPVALFFRARALLVSPVISAAQAQLGLQFVTMALASFPRNPGMHHTRAIFLLRQSSLTELEDISQRCLEEALESVETAMRWDAEFPVFYSTRAKVKYRLHDRAGALVDIRAAIELARYSASSPAVASDVVGWEAMLDSWQLTPLGSAAP